MGARRAHRSSGIALGLRRMVLRAAVRVQEACCECLVQGGELRVRHQCLVVYRRYHCRFRWFYRSIVLPLSSCEGPPRAHRIEFGDSRAGVWGKPWASKSRRMVSPANKIAVATINESIINQSINYIFSHPLDRTSAASSNAIYLKPLYSDIVRPFFRLFSATVLLLCRER